MAQKSTSYGGIAYRQLGLLFLRFCNHFWPYIFKEASLQRETPEAKNKPDAKSFTANAKKLYYYWYATASELQVGEGKKVSVKENVSSFAAEVNLRHRLLCRFCNGRLYSLLHTAARPLCIVPTCKNRSKACWLCRCLSPSSPALWTKLHKSGILPPILLLTVTINHFCSWIHIFLVERHDFPRKNMFVFSSV